MRSPGRDGGDGVFLRVPVAPVGDAEVPVQIEMRGGIHDSPDGTWALGPTTITRGRPSSRRVMISTLNSRARY